MPSTQDNSACMSRPHVSLTPFSQVGGLRGGDFRCFICIQSFRRPSIRRSFLPTFVLPCLMEFMEFLHFGLGSPSSPHLSQNHAGNVLNEARGTASDGEYSSVSC